MSSWTVKRFWTSATVTETENGFSVRLDDRPVRTPAKALLELPTKPMAQAVAAEWDAQSDLVDPAAMPVTRSANAAIDKVRAQFDEVVGMLAEYGATDLTCYRAGEPRALADRQAAGWDPLLDWAADRFGARLIPVAGVIHQPQPTASLARLRAPLQALTPFELAAMHDLVSLSGSLVIGLAAAEDAWTADALWQISRIDEQWQIEQWGADDEATRQAHHKRRAFLHAARFIGLSRGKNGGANG